MAAGFDGSVRIKAELEHSSFDKGVTGLGNTLKKFAGVVGAAFSITAIIKFGKESINTASELSNAWKGLQSIVEGQGLSFTKAKKFINEYISDGLVPLKNAVTAYKNLAARGYNDEQIKQTMASLKDAAAFGRQSSYTIGEAVETATEGLKNENSILVDNAGVTKNVAKMWDEYARSIGTTANNLTQEQKIQAEVNGILEETRFQVGDAAKVSREYSGQVSSLSYDFQNLKAAIGKGLIPIAQAVLPGISAVISGLTTLANVFAKVSSLLFGKGSSGLAGQVSTQKQIASSGGAAADATNELADATKNAGGAAKKAEKDMKGVLAGFDELNILADNAADSVGGAAGGVGGVSAGDIEIPEVETGGELFADVEISPKILEFVEKLKAAVEPIGKTLGEGLRWFYDNVLVPLGQWVVNDALPAFLDLLGAVLNTLNDVLIALQPAALWLWEKFLKPMASWVGGAFIDSLEAIADNLRDLGDLVSGRMSFSEFIGQLTPAQTASYGLAAALLAVKLAIEAINIVAAASKGFTAITTFISQVKNLEAVGLFGKLAEVFTLTASGAGTLHEAMMLAFGPGSIIAGIAAIVGGAVLAITNFIGMLQEGFSWVKEVLMDLGIAIAAVGAVILGAPALVTAVIAGIVAAVATLVVLVKEHWEEIKAAFSGVWESIKGTWSTVVSWFSDNIFVPLAGFFKAVGQTISDVFEGCWIIIQAIWKVVSGWFRTYVIDPLVNTFSPIVDRISKVFTVLWSAIAAVWSAAGTWFDTYVAQPIMTAFRAIYDFGRGVFNGIIGFAEGMINRVINAINSFLRIFSDVVSVAANFIGVSWSGVSLLPTVKLPRLANGAVIPPNQQFAAILGDQRSGTNIEAPLATIEQALQNVLDRNGGAGREIHITVESILDGKVVARNTVKHINDMTISAGRPVIMV